MLHNFKKIICPLTVMLMSLISVISVSMQNVYAGKSKSPKGAEAKAEATFNLYFPNAENVVWEVSGTNLISHFTLKNSKGKAQFDKKGHMICMLLYHHDTDLPLDIMIKIENQYPGFEVNNEVEYVDNYRHHIYFLVLENKTELLMIRVMGDTIEEGSLLKKHYKA